MNESHWCGWGHMSSPRVVLSARGEWFPKQTGVAVTQYRAKFDERKSPRTWVELYQWYQLEQCWEPWRSLLAKPKWQLRSISLIPGPAGILASRWNPPIYVHGALIEELREKPPRLNLVTEIRALKLAVEIFLKNKTTLWHVQYTHSMYNLRTCVPRYMRHHGCFWPRVTMGCWRIFFFFLINDRSRRGKRWKIYNWIKMPASYLKTKRSGIPRNSPKSAGCKARSWWGTMGPCSYLARSGSARWSWVDYSGILPQNPSHSTIMLEMAGKASGLRLVGYHWIWVQQPQYLGSG